MRTILTFVVMMCALSAQAQQTDEQTVTGMCASVMGLVAERTNDDALFVEAQWFGQFSTIELMDGYIEELQLAVEKDWEYVWPILIESIGECRKLRKELDE